LQALINELEKIIVHNIERKEISEDDIRKLLGITKKSVIFDLQDSFGEKASARFLQNLDSLLQQDMKYPQIVSSLYSRVVMLRQAKELIELERINVKQLFRMHYTKSNEFIKSLITSHKDRFDLKGTGNLLRKGIKFIEKMMKQSENFTNPQLASIMENLLEIDRKTKLSDISGEIQLQSILQNSSTPFSKIK